ncbi:CpsD/CapB family tyrosine-protein kinase [Paenibacillus sp. IB182496]|uniref:non-specific protein-tyrosine kinase n=1 Tax=Paenibacillus sabuli TaxID=2772509 RepID=A0A927BY06_9BACL|nr:CpsD/CapB family tyrosine-protein kinase [Paenibacillus sabuli]MBD2847564.1 CpsD/CapB family tyrosine-protein kinase [Paenibacillus sabuli]
MSRSNKRHLVTVANPKSPIAESYRALRTNVDYSAIDDDMQLVMVTSAGVGEGKSTTIANLAVTYAQMDRRVVLVDADMRKPTEHYTFGLSNIVGLSSVIAQQAELDQVLQPTSVPNLTVLTSGPVPPNPSEMLGSRRMDALLQELRGRFDMVLLDTPPLLAVTDAQILATKSDGVLLVIDYGKVKREIALQAKASLDKVRARILGVVMNNVKRNAKDNYYYYYGSGDIPR